VVALSHREATVSVSNQETEFQYTGNGLTVTFPYNCQVQKAGDLDVYLAGAIVTSGFTINGVGSLSGGSVTFSTAPAVGVLVRLERVVDLERTTDYQQNGDLLVRVVNPDFDRIWMAIQQQRTDLSRALRFPSTDFNPVTVLPSAAERANSVLGFDDLGQLIATIPGAGTAIALQILLNGSAGAAQIGYGADSLASLLRNALGHVVGSMADLLAINPSIYAHVVMAGYYAGSYLGGGEFDYDATYVGAGNGITIIPAFGGVGAWRRRISGALNQYAAGAVGDGAADDTVALPRWFDWAASGGYGSQFGIHGQTGRHRITGTGLKMAVADSLPHFTSDGPTNFVLTGSASVYLDFSVTGGSGQTAQVVWGGIGIDPTAKVSGSVGVLCRGICSVIFQNFRFNKLTNSVLFHNDKAGSFTELVVFDNPYFDTSVDGFLRYRVTLGNQSFRSSGMIRAKGNIGLTCDPVVYEANAVNYFGLVDITGWNYKPSCNFITNNSTQQIIFGDMSFEPLALPGGQDQALNKLVGAVGSFRVFHKGFFGGWVFNSDKLFRGVLTPVREFFNMADGGQEFLPENTALSVVTLTPGESFAIKYGAGVTGLKTPDSGILTVMVTAPGYKWKGMFTIRSGNTPNVVNATQLYTPDLFQDVGVTLGAMTVTQGTDTDVIVSNVNTMPAGSRIAYNIIYTHALIPDF